MKMTTYKLSELLIIKNGRDHQRLKDGDIPVYGSGGIMRYASNFLFDGESILLPRKGTLSNIQHVCGKFWAVDTTYYAVVDESKASTYYLYCYLCNLDLSGLDTGVSIPSMTTRTYYSIKVEIPDLATQHRIADILSAYDDLIENNNKRITSLERAAQELYKEWFVRFRFPGYESKNFENGLPKGWTRNRIGELYNTCSGGTPSRSNQKYYENGIYPWVKTGEIRDSIVIDAEEYISAEAIIGSSAKLLPPKSVAMAMYGVNIGMLAYFDREMACNQACCVFSDKRNFSSRHYLFHYLMSIRDYLLLIGFGAAQQNLSQNLINKIRIVMPTDELVVTFEKKIDDYYAGIRNLLVQNQNLAKQRDLLLPRLISGKLRV